MQRNVIVTVIALLFLIVVGIIAVQMFRAQNSPQSAQDAMVAAQQQVHETVQVMEQARAALSKLDKELDYPMSDVEKAAIRAQLENARGDFLKSGIKEREITELQAWARQSRDLAEEALQAARDGKRERAIDRFTKSRVKLLEARLGLVTTLRAQRQRGIALVEGAQSGLSSEAVSGGKPRELFTIRAPGVTGAIRIGKDGIKLEGYADDEQGSIVIGRRGVHISGEGDDDWGFVDITEKGVIVDGED